MSLIRADGTGCMRTPVSSLMTRGLAGSAACGSSGGSGCGVGLRRNTALTPRTESHNYWYASHGAKELAVRQYSHNPFEHGLLENLHAPMILSPNVFKTSTPGSKVSD